MNLDSMQEIVAAARREGKRFWEIILETDMENRGVSRSESMDKMALNWHTMTEASEVYTGDRRSLSGNFSFSGFFIKVISDNISDKSRNGNSENQPENSNKNETVSAAFGYYSRVGVFNRSRKTVNTLENSRIKVGKLFHLSVSGLDLIVEVLAYGAVIDIILNILHLLVERLNQIGLLLNDSRVKHNRSAAVSLSVQESLKRIVCV